MNNLVLALLLIIGPVMLGLILCYTFKGITIIYDWFTVDYSLPIPSNKNIKVYNTGNIGNTAVVPKDNSIPNTTVHKSSYSYTPTNPPRATFFGRIEGQEIIHQGPLEEKYLETWDYKVWKWRKERKAALADGILNEKTADEEDMPLMTTKFSKL